jgi:hypothetical protein
MEQNKLKCLKRKEYWNEYLEQEKQTNTKLEKNYVMILLVIFTKCYWAWGGVVVRALRYRSTGSGMGILSVASDNIMCPGSTEPLEISTRILLGETSLVA